MMIFEKNVGVESRDIDKQMKLNSEYFFKVQNEQMCFFFFNSAVVKSKIKYKE